MSLIEVGAGKSSTRSSSQSSAQQSAFDVSRTQQSLAFQDLFGGLYNNAATQASKISGAQTSNAAQQLFSSGSQFLQSLQGQGGAAGDYMTNRVTGADNVLGSQIDVLRNETGRLFSEQFNPAIASDAVGSRGYGGGRQGVAQGVAMSGLGREFTRGVVDLMGQSQQSRDTLASGLLTGETQRAGVGLSALESMLGVARTGEMSPLAGDSALAAILGGPTTLTDSFSFGSSQGSSQSTSKGKSKSKEGKLSFL